MSKSLEVIGLCVMCPHNEVLIALNSFEMSSIFWIFNRRSFANSTPTKRDRDARRVCDGLIANTNN